MGITKRSHGQTALRQRQAFGDQCRDGLSCKEGASFVLDFGSLSSIERDKTFILLIKMQDIFEMDLVVVICNV